MHKESEADGLTPGALMAATNYRTSVVDPRKAPEELTGPELFLLSINSNELARYNRDRIRYLQETNQQVIHDDESIGELIRKLYGRKN